MCAVNCVWPKDIVRLFNAGHLTYQQCIAVDASAWFDQRMAAKFNASLGGWLNYELGETIEHVWLDIGLADETVTSLTVAI